MAQKHDARLRSEVDQLEEELRRAQQEVARRGGDEFLDVGGNWFVGTPLGRHLEKDLPFAITGEGYDAIARRLGGSDQVQRMGRVLVHAPQREQRTVVAPTVDGGTHIDVKAERYLAPWGILVVGLPTAFVLTLSGVLLTEYLGVVSAGVEWGVIAVAILLGWLAFRAVYSRYVRTLLDDSEKIYEDIVELAEAHPANARIVIDDDAEAEREAAAEEEAARAEPRRATGSMQD